MEGTIRDEIAGAVPGVESNIPVEDAAPLSAPGVNPLKMVGDLLMIETGPGEIDPDYTSGHPLNPGRSLGLGQILRGLTGLMLHFNLGTLRKAVIDLVVGFIKWRGEGKHEGNPGYTAGDFGR